MLFIREKHFKAFKQQLVQVEGGYAHLFLHLTKLIKTTETFSLTQKYITLDLFNFNYLALRNLQPYGNSIVVCLIFSQLHV